MTFRDCSVSLAKSASDARECFRSIHELQRELSITFNAETAEGTEHTGCSEPKHQDFLGGLGDLPRK
jgi:hypothetical protein